MSSNSCYNIDYLIRLQRTVDFLDVSKIVEVGFGDWSLTRLIHLEGKQYVGYVIYQNSTFLWMPAKDKLVSCPDIEDLREINKRCELGLDI